MVSLVPLSDVLFKTELYTNNELGHYHFCCILLFTKYYFFLTKCSHSPQSFNNPDPSIKSFHRDTKSLYSKQHLILACTKCYICHRKVKN